MTSGNVEDLWEVRLADELPSTLVADVFEWYYARVYLPEGVALSSLAYGAGIEFGATPALSDDPIADYVTAAGANLKNVNGVVSNSPLSGITTPAGGQDFWIYVKDTSGLGGDASRIRRVSARQAVLNSIGWPATASPVESTVGDASWFIKSGSVTVPANTQTFVTLAALNDGVAEGTDVILNVDPTAAEVVTPGTYLVSAQVFVHPDAADVGNPIRLTGCYLVLNDDSVGPLYYAGGGIRLDVGVTSAATAAPGLPVVLAEGDLIKISLTSQGNTEDLVVTGVVLVFIKIA